MPTSVEQVKTYLLALQKQICLTLEQEDGRQTFLIDDWTSERGYGSTRVLSHGAVFEKAGVNFSYVRGDSLPQAATAKRPELAGKPFEAMGVSLVVHPDNPYVPTSHANVRFICVHTDEPTWWFGGGFDLTPYYPFEEDCIFWHQQAKAACDPFGEEIYPQFKRQCDAYFYLKHRQETRGIGGLFFDDYCEQNFEHSFALMKSIGDHYLKAYQPIVAKRKNRPFTDREKQFQLLRRGRYVEFNLLYDRGTHFGLQFGGRIESILISLPALVRWDYDFKPEPNTPEAEIYRYLQPVDWLSIA